jgi:PAS domain S-box-containing protein
MTVERDAKELGEASSPPQGDGPFLTAFHMSPSLIAVSTIAEGRFLVVNEAFAKKTGYALADIIGKTSRELDLFSTYSDRAATLEKLRAQGMARDVRVDVRTKDGTLLKGFFHAQFIPYQGQHCLLTIFNDMTETLDAMQALAASEAKYRTLAESSPEMIYVIDRQGVVQYVNPAGLAHFAGVEGSVIGKHLRDLYPPAIAERHLGAIAAVVDTGRPLTSELLEHFPTGARWIDARLSPIRDATSAITGVLGMSQDITERKRAEERAVVQRDLALALLQTTDLALGLRACFESALRVSGMDCGGIYLRDARSGDLRLVHHQGLSAAFVDAVRHVPADAPNTAVVMAGKPVYAPRGALPASALLGPEEEGLRSIAVIPFAHRDEVIGCLNLASHALAEVPIEAKVALETIVAQIGSSVAGLRAAAALQESEERFRAIFEQASVGIAMADQALRFTRVNGVFSSMLGWSEQDLAGVTLRDIIDPDDRVTEGECLDRLSHGETRRYTAQKRYLRKGGGSLWADLSVSAMYDASGDFLQYLVVMEDISARKRAEEELQRANRIEALKVFAGGIAHDFNNLLSGMLGYLDLARQELPHHHPACEYLDKSFPAFERAKDLARQMLTFAKGGAPLKKPLELPDLLRSSCQLALSGSNIRCDYHIDDDLWPVEGDEHQLAQVWSNLALNAWQAMPDGGTITISAENRALAPGQVGKLAAGRYVAVAVRDEGMGIPEKIIDKVFDPFFTTKHRGSGLGLATSHSIVTRHGGHIGVASRPAEGSVFTVFLPASSGPAANPPKTAPDVDWRGSGRVLVMDDERDIREMIRDILSRHGYEVEVAADGRASVDMYARAMREAKGFDLVILDLTVPGGTGGAWALRELKKLDPHVVAIVSSGYSDHAELTHFEEHGFSGMVAKPYRASVLLLAVRNALGRKGSAEGGNDAQP